MFTHRHAFREAGGNQPINKQFDFWCLSDLKKQFPQVFAEPQFPIVCDGSAHFEYKIRLKDKGVPPPLDQEDLTELKKQIMDILEKNKIKPSNSPYGAPIFFAKKKMGTLDFAQIIGRLIRILQLILTPFQEQMNY